MCDWIADAEWFYRGHLNNRHQLLRDEARDCHELLERAIRFSLEQPILSVASLEVITAGGDFAIAHTVLGSDEDRRIALVHCCPAHCLVMTLHGVDWSADSGRSPSWPKYNWRRASIGVVAIEGEQQWCEFRDVDAEARPALERSALLSLDAWREAITMGAPSDGYA